ncbi:MAG: two-component sensor histidine kinase, partial [Actinobacteria bacterium]|nr:two-component sensor histidine kinase [Actinomycetota bacterium]
MRKRIVLLVAATTSVVLLAFALPLIALVRDQAKSAAIENGRTVAQALVPVVSNGDSAQISLVLNSLNEPEGISTTVILANGSAISTSTISDPDISAIAANAARDGATTVAT